MEKTFFYDEGKLKQKISTENSVIIIDKMEYKIDLSYSINELKEFSILVEWNKFNLEKKEYEKISFDSEIFIQVFDETGELILEELFTNEIILSFDVPGKYRIVTKNKNTTDAELELMVE